MEIRNEKHRDGHLVYYRMVRGDTEVSVAVSVSELEVGREVVALRLRNARAQFAKLRRWGLLR
jgi:hypothetical protein